MIFFGINCFTLAFVAHVDNVDQEKPSWKFSLQIIHSQNPDGYKIGSQLATAKYPVCAGGLRKVLKYIKENYKYPEMIVTGNERHLERKMYFRMRSATVTGSITAYETTHSITWSSGDFFFHSFHQDSVRMGGNDYPGDDMSGAQSVTEKLSNVAQNGVPVTAPPLQGQSVEDVSSVEDRA